MHKDLKQMNEAYQNMLIEDKLTPEVIAGLINDATNNPNNNTLTTLVTALKTYTQVLDYPGIEGVSSRYEFSASDNIFTIALTNGDYISYYYQGSEFGTHQNGTVKLNGQEQKFNMYPDSGRFQTKDVEAEKSFYKAVGNVLHSLVMVKEDIPATNPPGLGPQNAPECPLERVRNELIANGMTPTEIAIDHEFGLPAFSIESVEDELVVFLDEDGNVRWFSAETGADFPYTNVEDFKSSAASKPFTGIDN